MNIVNDIKQKLESNERYQIIKSSGLLRHLFLDREPLIHKVNKTYRHPIIFHTCDFKSVPPLNPTFYWRDFNPITKKTLKIKLSDFLNAICFSYHNYEYDVKDIIKGVAHLMGGIHLGKPENEKERTLLKLDKLIPIMPDAALNSIQSISVVSLNALEPLIE